MQLRRPPKLAAATFSAFAFTLVFPLFFSVRVQAQGTCSQSYIDSLPVATPISPAVRVLQLVNCSPQTILGASNAAAVAGHPPYPVFPREGTWVMQPFGAPNNANVLTIDVPPQWAGTVPEKSTGPNLWVRTGCRYDLTTNRAQCETGGCAGQYDCSSGGFGPPGFTTLTEWTFYDPVQQYHFDYPDISAVNGANLNVDVEPVDGSLIDPTAPDNALWLKYNYPLVVHGGDLRAASSCSGANGDFLLKRSDIDKSKDPLGHTKYGYVIADENGNPVMPLGDNALACFTNCGKFEYPDTPAKDCDPSKDGNCYAWKTFCAGDPDLYGKTCTSDAECITKGSNVHASCWKNTDPDQKSGTCSLRSFYKEDPKLCPDEPAAPASKVACSFYYGATNPLTGKKDYSTQPPTFLCGGVIGPDGKPVPCIGDDTVHQVLHGAYTWPNDPEVFTGDAQLYRIIISPGGTEVPITAAEDSIPLCESLPGNYDYSENRTNCGIPVDHQGAVFAVATVSEQSDGKWESNGHDWGCNLDQRGSGDNGVICRWHPAPATNCTPPVTDQYVTKSACGLIESGASLVSSSMTPGSNDPLFAEVTIPAVLNLVQLPVISGCASSWSVVNSQFINTNQGLAVWYSGRASSGSECQVTVTLASSNPAALKVYDVPSSNGIIDATSSNSGMFAFGGPPYPLVSAGVATTTHQPDLMLGDLLQVNRQATPITYWVNWLTNNPMSGPNCLPNDNFCPTDDGTDYLPGHGPNSSNADVGHKYLNTTGMQSLQRNAQNLGSFAWGGVAIYVELNP